MTNMGLRCKKLSGCISESDCKGFFLKISCVICLLIIISLSSYHHHHELIIISSLFHHHFIIISSSSSSLFFLRLPYGQYGPVSQLSRSEKSCTGPFNWGEAHCAGEKVKRRTGPFLRKSLTNQTRTRTQPRGAARHGNQEPPGQAPRCTGRKNQQQQTRDFKDKSWYALTYKEVP